VGGEFCYPSGSDISWWRAHDIERTRDVPDAAPKRVARGFGASLPRMILHDLGAYPPHARRARRGWGTLYPGVSCTMRAPAPPQPRGPARPGAQRKGLRLRLIPPLWAGAEGAADGRSPAHPRERLDRRGMCRGVRGTSRHAQMT
jgi:hypothetical protein